VNDAAPLVWSDARDRNTRCCFNWRVEIADVRFVEVDGLAIAWQQFGAGPDCLVIPPLVSNVELYWEHEFFRRWMDFHARHMRVTHFDKRGIGLSDRVDQLPSLEERIHDIAAVMDAAGLERAHVFAMSEGGLMAQLFAARFPERVERLVLVNSLTIGYPTDDESSREISGRFDRLIEEWGRDPGYFLEWFSPSQATNETFARWWLRLQRQSATKTDFARQVASVVALATEPIDPDFVASIAAPTLVVNMTRDQVVEPASGDWLAAKLPNATRVTFDSDDHFFFAGAHWFEMITLVVEFMIGAPIHAPSERKLAAVVFTDIVGSTAATAAVGDAAWGAALDEHDRIAWATSDRYSGTIVKSTGDGLLVYFDTPHSAIGFCRDLRTGLDQTGLHIRAGIHVGEIEVRPNSDITGIAVNLAARIEQSAPDAAIYVSSTVRDMLLGGETCFEDRGEHVLKGFDQHWKLYELIS
jgi:class 3 adenylate cyclase/pimeloyl-ACP methyl ester carboxylesterase